MPRWAAKGSAASRANNSAGTSSCGSAMIGPYDLRVPPTPRADPLRVPPTPRAMTPRSFLLTQELSDYVRAVSEPPDQVARDLVAETATLADRGEVPPTFQIAAEQGAFLQLLTRALGVRTAIEIGTFTAFW